MTTSGTVIYNPTATILVAGALRLLGATDPENPTPTTAMTNGGIEALEMMVKAWQANGLQLWERKWGVIFPVKGQRSYVLGTPGPGGDHACVSTPEGTGFIQTTTTVASAAGASTITVSSATSTWGTVGNPNISITNGYYIGVELADGTSHWTTVNGAPAGNVVTLTDVVPSAGVGIGATVYCYQTKLTRPLRVLDGWVRQIGGNDTPYTVIPRENYNRFGSKSSQGTINQVYYDPQMSGGVLYVYPTTQNMDQPIFIEFQSAIQDVTTGSNTMDLPQEWMEAIKFNLALRLAPEYEVTPSKFSQVAALAKASFDLVDSFDQETGSLFIQPDSRVSSQGYGKV